jgi:hypothetical protein
VTVPAAKPARDACYVTIRRGPRTCYAAGPFADPASADPWVDPVRAAAGAVDPWTWFDSFGVTRVTHPRAVFPPGRLNARLGLPPDPRTAAGDPRPAEATLTRRAPA